ncbi:MAG: alanine racemase, partial [Halothiobacillus sp.]|nr:alanine racemase [Halothiobacillus sp.]
NSAAILGWSGTHADWARPGIMLYGADPFVGKAGASIAERLRPVMQLEGAVISVRVISYGEPLGYGDTFVAERPTRVGVVSCGYADVGSRVELWGDQIPVNEVASRAGTIAYELLCHVKRARFEYSGQSH